MKSHVLAQLSSSNRHRDRSHDTAGICAVCHGTTVLDSAKCVELEEVNTYLGLAAITNDTLVPRALSIVAIVHLLDVYGPDLLVFGNTVMY